MQSKETKVFVVDGKNVRFDAKTFESSFRAYAERGRMTFGKLEEVLAEQIGVSKDAVHNWRFGHNGPSEIEMLHIIAEVFCVSDWKMFTKSIDGGETMKQLTERQKDSVKKIYDAIMDFLYEFRRTDGFNDYWEKYYPIAQKNTEHRLYECVQEKVEQLFLLLDKEYFELGKHEIYGKLCEYVSDKIYATFDGKLSYGYRFEALADGNPTTDEDYDKAMKGINEIIDMF